MIENQPTSPARITQYIALAAILLVSIVLHFVRLWDEGFANLYYAATVKSMLTSWHNFFYASFDPGGFVSVDKPPLGLWVQALSAMIFGFNGVALLLPQAIAGVLSVALLYHLVARVFGATAGVIAALVLTLTPISLAADRNNTMDAQLVFVLLLAAWAVSIAAERGKLSMLIVSAILVGVGFNIKMLQAYMVLPALFGMYLIAARTAWWKRIAHVIAAMIPLVIVSFVWVAIVDLTPADARPFVGSSTNNSEMELIVGHNGVQRLGQIASWVGLRNSLPQRQEARLGAPANGQPSPQPGDMPRSQLNPPAPGNQPRAGYPQQAPRQPQQPGASPPNVRGNQPNPGNPPPQNPGQNPPVPNVPPILQNETGDPGIFRLFNQQLAGQASWFLPLAFLGFIAAALATKIQYPFSREHQQLLLWMGWLAPMVIFFSFAGLFHRYYLEMLAPAIAALVGAGLAAMWNWYTQHRARGMSLPLAILFGAITQTIILRQFNGWGWLIAAVLGASVLFSLALALARLNLPRLGRLHKALAAAAIPALCLAPTVWAITPVIGADAALPYAGPELLARPARAVPPNESRWLDYLSANYTGEKFIAATLNANTAAPIILATNQPVMAVGGFGGNDKILTTEQFSEMVTNGVVRFFVLGGPGNPDNEITRWVEQNCASVRRGIAPAQNPGGGQGLYDCKK